MKKNNKIEVGREASGRDEMPKNQKNKLLYLNFIDDKKGLGRAGRAKSSKRVGVGVEKEKNEKTWEKVEIGRVGIYIYILYIIIYDLSTYLYLVK